MKATATVPPFLNFNMRAHQEHQTPVSNNSADGGGEGGFAAALRKLAQQTPGGFTSRLMPRGDAMLSPSGKSMIDPVYSLSGRISGIPSIIGPPSRPFPPAHHPRSRHGGVVGAQDGGKSQQDLLLKASHGHHRHPREHHPPPHGHANPTVPPNEEGVNKHAKHQGVVAGVFQFGSNNIEEHMRRKSQDKIDSRDRTTHTSKEQRPSVGLVHPQPSSRKHSREEEIVKSSASMNSMHHFSPRDSVTLHSLSPTELSRFGPTPSSLAYSALGRSSSGSSVAGHSHGPQTSCPVHGQESGSHPHPHDHHERNGRQPTLSFDQLQPPHGFHSLHSGSQQHQRYREDMFMRRHSLDRKEHLPPHHALEEDLRRRGLDYRGAFAGLPPHLLEEQYRRHLMNGSHDHNLFKEPGHGQVFVPPHFYYGREYPPLSAIDHSSYHPHSAALPSQSELLHRFGAAVAAPPVSPRLLEAAYHRHNSNNNMEPLPHHGSILSAREYEAAVAADRRSYEERRELEHHQQQQQQQQHHHQHKDHHQHQRPTSIDILKRKHQNHVDEASYDRHRKHSISSIDKKPHIVEEKEPPVMKMPIFKGLEYNNNTIKPQPKMNGTSHQANSITSLLSNKKLPSSKSELDAASILANMNRINQSPCSDEMESVASGCGPEISPPAAAAAAVMKQPIKEENKENIEESEEKLNYLLTLGLVTHTRKRVLEEEYDRKRWDRKLRKYRGRPKKRSKRENTEDGSLNGDLRPGSELDFYNGPMTRHKQQLLQEQENLLEQIQKQHNGHAATTTTEGGGGTSATEGNNNNNTEPPQQQKKGKRSPRNSHRKTSIMTKSTGGDEEVSPTMIHNGKIATFIKTEENDMTATTSTRETSRKLSSTTLSPSANHHTHAHNTQHADNNGGEATSSSGGKLMAMLKDNPPLQQKQQQHHVLSNGHCSPPPATNFTSPSSSSSFSSSSSSLEKHHHNHQSPSHHYLHNNEHSKRQSTNHNPHSDHVTRPSTNHNSNATYAEHVEKMRKLDKSLFGRHMEPGQDHYVRWPGISYIHHAYSSYTKECDLQRQHLLQSYEELQRESHCLHQKREFLEKDMLVYDQRRVRIAERRRNMQANIESVHQALRSMSDL